MKCGDMIAELRGKRGMTQADLAVKLGITRASLSHYETNRRQPDFETLSAIADFFAVSTDYIMGRRLEQEPGAPNEISEFVNHLELSDQAILERYELTVDGRKLTADEARRFIAFIRAERSIST